jgi:Helix-turn-helix of DDE superfamily endonuclease
MLGLVVHIALDLFQNLTVCCYTGEMTKQKTSPTQALTASKYHKLSTLKDGPFRRLTGVSRRVFALMVEILTVADAQKKARGGRASKLCIEDRLLMALEYLREYRTYFHIAQNYGISESNAYKICKWVEDTLMKDKRFALPGRKALLGSDAEYEVILIDASESPIERPKKDKNAITLAKRSAILSKHSSS